MNQAHTQTTDQRLAEITPNIKLFHGDCMDLLSTIPSESVNLLLTDPPFGMNYESKHSDHERYKIKNDDNLDWLPGWMDAIARVMAPNGHLYIFCSWHKVDVFKQAIERHYKIKNLIVWAKNGGGMGDLSGGYGGRHELIFFVNKGRDLNGRRDTDVVDKAYRTGNEYHPTQKPVQMMEYFIEKSTRLGDMVLDCFSGSGSTAVACHNTGRKFIGAEMDDRFFEISKKRLEQMVTVQRLDFPME